MAAKYSENELRKMLAKGHAIRNAKGEPSFPIEDRQDLERAIAAVGRAGREHNAIRAYIIRRAKAMGLSNLIPDNWNSDGSLKD